MSGITDKVEKLGRDVEKLQSLQDNGGSSGVTSVTATTPIASSGGTTPVISLNNSGVTPGTYTNATVILDSHGLVTAAGSGTSPVTSVGVTAPVTSTGGTTPTIGLSVTPANPGGAVALQGAYPGTVQTGNVHVNGTLGADSAVLVNGQNLNPVQKNWLINGNMDICQRFGPNGSASVSTSKTYVLDRWASIRDGSGATVTISQQSFTLGQTAVPGEPTYFLRHAQTVAGTGSTFNYLRQYIEDVRTLAGQTATLSFWAKADASRNITPRIRQYFGTGGSPSADVVTSGSAVGLTTSWQQFSTTFSVPSISGKTLGSNNDHALVIEFSLPVNTAMTIDFARSQFEFGANISPFFDNSFLEELRDCYRYYRKCFQYATTPANSNSQGALLNTLPPVLAGSFFLPSIPLGVALRISPVAANCTFYNSGGGTAGQVFNFTRSNSSTTVTINAAGSSETVIAFQVTAFPVGWAATDLFSVAWAIDVEL